MALVQKKARNSTYALVLLTTIYILGYADRSIINLLLDSIKTEFQLSDTVLGLITGFGFSLFQVSLGIPIARLADRSNRVNILTAGLLLWSTMTLLCGRVSSAWQLAAARMAVGTGEACLVAPSHSLLTDFTPKKNRTRAFGVLASGGDIGIMLGSLIGGWVGHYYGWRTAFIVAGLPGIVVGLLFWLTLKEPERESSPHTGSHTGAHLVEPFWVVGRFLWNQKSYVYGLLGACAVGLTLFPLQVWGPAFLRRIHHLDNADVGTYMGLIRFASIAGVITGGIVTDYMCRRNEHWRLRVPAVACTLVAPAYLLFLFADSMGLALTGLALVAIGVGAHQAALYAVCQTVVKPHMRAVSAATFVFCSSMVGSGLGSLLIGMLSDGLTPQFGETALRYALLLSVFTALLAGFFMWRGGRSIESDMVKATS